MKTLFLLLIAVIDLASALTTSKPCYLFQTEYGYNCMCSNEYCDTLDVPDELKSGDQFIWIKSSEDGDRFFYEYGNFSTQNTFESSEEEIILRINQEIKYEKSKIIGFGGGFTGAVSYILNQMPSKLKKYFYESYFSKKNGIGYNILRIPIGGSDYDLEQWTYAMEPENDTELSSFTELDERDKIRNAQIKEAKEITGNDDIILLGATWSPPRWMKANRQWYRKTDNQVLPEYYQTWADYHVKWLNLMKDDGMSVWGLSTGNEPFFARNQICELVTNSWEPSNQSDWFIDYLVPALKRSGNSDVKIHLYDDNRDTALEYLEKMVEQHNDVMKYADYINLHAYFDSTTSPDVLDEIYGKYDKQILYTEMSFAVFEGDQVLPGSWPRCEELIKILMETLQHNVAAFIDWNLILASTGGPSYLGSFIEAYILANEDFTVFYKQPFFYAMAHFAKFIPPHSIRINSTFSSVDKSVQVEAVAYHRPDNKITLIMYNNNINPVALTLIDDLKGTTNLKLKPKSLNTLVYS